MCVLVFILHRIRHVRAGGAFFFFFVVQIQLCILRYCKTDTSKITFKPLLFKLPITFVNNYIINYDYISDWISNSHSSRGSSVHSGVLTQ